MGLTKKQFDILSLLESNTDVLSQREISKLTGISLGSVNKNLAELNEFSYVKNGQITDLGLEALEPYRVKSAVFMAAGFGSRMVPITLNTPKPLVRVCGKRIIDTLLDAVVGIGIEEIYIVRGYLSEQFDQLLKKYPQIKFIDNPVYNETNNISSIYCARHLISNSYVFEADLVLYNPKLITKYQYRTNYLGVSVDRTEDWCFTTNSNLIIKKMGIGGFNCYHMYGLSYWTKEDGAKLCKHIQDVYENLPGGKEKYWDQVVFDCYPSEYEIYVRPCSFDDIVEIDTFNELKKIDPNYAI